MAAMTANRQLRFSFFCKISFESTRCWSRDRNSGRFLRSFLSRRHTSSDASRSASNFPSSMSATDTCSDGSVQSIMNIQNMLKNTVPLKTESKLLSSCVKVTKASVAIPMSTHSELQYDYGHRFEDYDKSRRAVNGGLTHKALLVDAAGTLLVPSQPAAKIYQLIGRKYGVTYSEEEILARYRWAYSQPWCRSRLRYVKDGRPFWQFIVEQASGCSNSQYFEELYQYYATAEAWQISDPEAGKVLKSIRDAGVKLAVVSNFDTRLRPLMHALECFQWFDALAVSAEVEAEKPNPTIFFRACELLGVNPEDAVHVGDDRRNDIWGARDAGCDAWLWGADVFSFREVAERIGVCVSSN